MTNVKKTINRPEIDNSRGTGKTKRKERGVNENRRNKKAVLSQR